MTCGPLQVLFKRYGLEGMGEGLTLILVLLLSVPLAYVYHMTVYAKRHEFGRNFERVSNLFTITTSVLLLYICYGYELVYVLLSIAISYLLILCVGTGFKATILNFAVSMGFLLSAYYYYMTDSYDINWTTCQCVMTLRLIGAAIDLYDGTKDVSIMSADQKKYHLKAIPGAFNFLAYCLFFPCVFVGPQISLKEYNDFMYLPAESIEIKVKGLARNNLAECGKSALKVALSGIGFIASYQVGSIYFSSYAPMMDPSFGFVNTMLYSFCYCNVFIFKYVACWKFSEAACRASGIAYHYEATAGRVEWKYANIHPFRVILASNFSEIIKNFNINTNMWAARFIFKRLAVLGNRNLSQLVTLMYLALWHGFHLSYFFAFSIELIEVVSERILLEAYKEQLELIYTIKSPLFQYLRWIFAVTIRTILLNFGILSFDLFTISDTLRILKNMNYLPLIIIIIEITLIQLKPYLFPQKRKSKKIE